MRRIDPKISERIRNSWVLLNFSEEIVGIEKINNLDTGSKYYFIITR